MKNIAKSFYNYMLTFWYQFLAFVLFVLIAVALTIGFVSNSLQVIAITGQIQSNEKQWDVDVNTYFSQIDDEFIYEYFEHDSPTQLSFDNGRGTLLNYQYMVDETTDLKTYLDEAFNYSGTRNKADFLGKFIRSNIFASGYRNEHLVVLPKNNANSQTKLVSFFDIINPEWKLLTGSHYGQIYNLIIEDIIKNYNQTHNDYLEISVNKLFKFSPDNSDHTYSLEPTNIGKINNVVSLNLSQNQIKNMKDNEILVNDKFAKLKGWKIGDKIKLHDFELKNDTDREFYETQLGKVFNQEYKIIGWGMKIQNLFATYNFFDPDHVDNTQNTGFFYLNNREFDRYWTYLWYYNNRVYYPKTSLEQADGQANRSLGNQDRYYKRLAVKNGQTIDNFNQAVRPYFSGLRIALYYGDIFFARAFQMYLIEGIIFAFVGLISLIFAVLFINYSIKKQLRQMRSQLGLFKSMGYGTMQLSTILWSRTYVLLIVGTLIGYVISIPIQFLVNKLLVPNFYVIVEPIWSNPIFLFAVFGLLPLVMSLLNFAAIVRYLSKNALSMIYMDKNFSMGSSYGRTMSWIIKSRSINLGKIHLNFSWKQFFMALFIPLFFMFGSLLLMIQFNINTLMDSTFDINSHIYNKNISYGIEIDQRFNQILQAEFTQDGPYFVRNENFANFDYVDYSKISDLDQYHNLDLDRAMAEYLKPNSNLFVKIVALKTISQANINHKAVNMVDFLKLANQIVIDYDYAAGTVPGLDEYATLVSELRTLLELTKEYPGWVSNKNTVLTFNNAFIKRNVDYPILKMKLFGSRVNSYGGDVNLFMVNEHNKAIFADLDYNLLSSKTNQEKTADAIPIIVSEQYSVKNGMTIGKEFNAYLDFSGSNIYLRFKIIGVNNDKVSSNFYGLESYFLKNFVKSSPTQVDIDEHIYNSIYSKAELFDLTNLNLKNLNLKNDYFNFYYATSQEEVSLVDVFNNPQRLVNYFNWANLAQGNFKSIALERHLAMQTISGIVELVYILLGFTLLLLLTLFGVFFILGTVDNQMKIKLFKAYGYTKNYISLHLLNRHIVSISFGVVCAIIINYFVWKFMIDWVFNSFGLMLYNPFTALTTTICCLIIIGLFIMGSMLTYYIIHKTSPVIKAI